MGRAPAAKHNDHILSSRAGNAIGKRCVRTPHGRLQRRRDRRHSNIGAGRRPCPEGLLDTFDDPVEQSRLGRRINHCEAVYEPAIAAEDHLFVKGLAVAFTGQRKPAAADSAVRDVVVRVRFARDLLLVRRGTLPVAVGQSPNEQTRIAVPGDEHLAVACLRRPLRLQDVRRVTQEHSITLVTVSDPVPVTRLSLGRRQLRRPY